MNYAKAFFYNLWKLYIGVWFITTLLLFYPLFWVLLRKVEWRRFTFPINVFWSRLMRMVCFYAVELEGEIEVKNSSPFLICANHTSYLDIFLMYSILPKHKFLFMGKSEILSYPLVKTFFKRLNIPVFRTDRVKAARSFILAKKNIDLGWSVVIFPEGGIPEHPPKMVPLKDGAFKLAKAAEIGVLAMTFKNNYKLFSDPEYVFASARPGLVKVNIHPFINKEDVCSTTVEKLNNYVFNLLNSPLVEKFH